jgi:hypothetical protein
MLMGRSRSLVDRLPAKANNANVRKKMDEGLHTIHTKKRYFFEYHGYDAVQGELAILSGYSAASLERSVLCSMGHTKAQLVIHGDVRCDKLATLIFVVYYALVFRYTYLSLPWVAVLDRIT